MRQNTKSGMQKGPALKAFGREFVLYTAISFAALVFDYGTYWLLADLSGLDLGTAAAIGYSLGLVVSYVLLTRSVFVQRRLSSRKGFEMSLFALSGVIGLILTYATVSLLYNIAGADMHEAKFAAIGISFIAVYLFRKLVVFAPHARGTDNEPS